MSVDPYPQPHFTPVVGEPAWDVALLYPVQGSWSEQDYLDIALTQNKLVEYSQGCVEFLPLPSRAHQLLVKFLLKALEGFVEPGGLGLVLSAPLPVCLNPQEYREPDLIFNFAANHAKRAQKYYERADLVMEVVSDDKRSHDRDYEAKRRDYAQAGIAEYWIVDPRDERVTVLALVGTTYVEHAVTHRAGRATSKLLDGFSVDVASLFAAGKA